MADLGKLQRHIGNVAIARRLTAASLRETDNCAPTKAVQIAAFDCLNESPTMTLKAFMEGAAEACWMKPSTIRTCWYRGRREWLDAPTFSATLAKAEGR